MYNSRNGGKIVWGELWGDCGVRMITEGQRANWRDCYDQFCILIVIVVGGILALVKSC